MTIESVRKVISLGGSVAVVLPLGWARAAGIAPGDKVLVRCNRHVVISKLRKE